MANWPGYGPWRIPVAAAWLAHLVVGVLAGWSLLVRDRVPVLWFWYALLALTVDVTLMAATAPDGLVGPANWGWGSVGWLGCLIFWRRRQSELVGFLAANAALMVIALTLGVARPGLGGEVPHGHRRERHPPARLQRGRARLGGQRAQGHRTVGEAGRARGDRAGARPRTRCRPAPSKTG
ncbi:hypothetical protein [Herbidospora mongoliensis]|uniref:hypothetical protein n=1 Tax=Herbidospora mongoliensis TaxID=688067 RepID=UPI000A4304CF|nr:hypothetical protein [Herbidospora mongoliensis]